MRGFVLVVMIALLPSLAAAEQVIVFAASSLKPALEPVAQEWAAQSGNTVKISFGSSAALAQQIEAGAPADVFLSAAPKWVDYLQVRHLVDPASRVDLWGNSLSLIAHDMQALPIVLEPGVDLAGVIGTDRLAMALVESVPVGEYGKAALQNLGLWDGVKGLVVQTQDARATMALVATGEAGFGVVFATDAIAARALGQGIEIGRFPKGSHAPIVYPGVKVAASLRPESDELLRFLASPAARDAFAALGYVVLSR